MELDFSSQGHYLVAFVPELILTALGMLVLIAGVSRRLARDPERSFDIGWLALAGVLLAAFANGWMYGVHEVGTQAMIAVDRFRLFANWVLLGSAGLAVVMSMAYVDRQRLQAGEYYGLLLFSTVGMMVMAAARDLIVIFLGLELMSIAVYAMTALNRAERRSAEAGLKYFILGAFATGFFLYGIALVYGATGSTNIARIAVEVGSGSAQPALLALGVGLMLVGFAFKVGAVPFHMWTPDVYEGAPTPVTAFMSAGVKAAAFVAFLRVFTVAFDGVWDRWWTIVWWLAALSMVAANLLALAQLNVKRMLAYSSIAHAGYLLVAIVAANQAAAAGMLFYLLVYAVMNVGAFGIVLIVANQGEDRLLIEDYAGFGQQQPLLGVLLTIFLLSLAGFPGTGGFMGKIYLLQGAMGAHLVWLSVVLVLTTVVSYGYYLRLAWYMWMSEAPTPDVFHQVRAPISMRIALLAAAALILYLGVFPDAALEMARASVDALTAFGGSAAATP
ncbi:MAG: NADH-quinone oxidoreductase subunit N [Gemmatimonadetes bacterium]|nr:MAG: NADH-quinone oxidoreductase subunit N [Gemmatimonadota bacterium]